MCCEAPMSPRGSLVTLRNLIKLLQNGFQVPYSPSRNWLICVITLSKHPVWASTPATMIYINFKTVATACDTVLSSPQQLCADNDKAIEMLTSKQDLTWQNQHLHINCILTLDQLHNKRRAPLTQRPMVALSVLCDCSWLPSTFFVGTCFPFRQLSSNTSSLAMRHWRAFQSPYAHSDSCAKKDQRCFHRQEEEKKKGKYLSRVLGRHFLDTDSRQLYNPMAAQTAVPFSLFFQFFYSKTHIL